MNTVQYLSELYNYYNVGLPYVPKNNLYQLVEDKIASIQAGDEPFEYWEKLKEELTQNYPEFILKDLSFHQHPSVILLLEDNENNNNYCLSFSMICNVYTVFEEKEISYFQNDKEIKISIINDLLDTKLFLPIVENSYPQFTYETYSSLKSQKIYGILPIDEDSESRNLTFDFYRVLFGQIDNRLNVLYNPKYISPVSFNF